MVPCWLQQKKNNRLEIPKGEYIGKTVYHSSRNSESTPKVEGGEYYDIIVNSNLDEIDSQGEISICIIKRTWLQLRVICQSSSFSH